MIAIFMVVLMVRVKITLAWTPLDALVDLWGMEKCQFGGWRCVKFGGWKCAGMK